MNWEYLREEEFPKAIDDAKGLCIVPIGCMEKHGQHLPVGTDGIRAMRLASRAAEIEPAVVFPNALWLGDVMGYHRHSREDVNEKRLHGGIGLSPELLLSVYHELCVEISRNGFRKILFLNTHGGNNGFLEFFARSENYEKSDYRVFFTSGGFNEITPERTLTYYRNHKKNFPEITEEDIETLERFRETGTGGGHADFRETAMGLYEYPEAVSADAYEKESGTSLHLYDDLEKHGIHAGFFWSGNYPNMYQAYPPVGASAGIGRVMMQISAEQIAKKIALIKNREFD